MGKVTGPVQVQCTWDSVSVALPGGRGWTTSSSVCVTLCDNNLFCTGGSFSDSVNVSIYNGYHIK